MVYTYRVTLPGIKGFYRVYKVNAENSLYSFYKQMRDDMEFPRDQVILFKGLDSSENVAARYGLVDLGFGTVDGTTMSQTVKKGVHSFVFFYDVTNRKSVIVTLEGEENEPGGTRVPVLVDVKGPNPIEFENGYVAFEDLPDDQRHLPSESDRNRKSGLSGLLDAIAKDDEDDEDLDDEDGGDVDDDDDDDEEDDEPRGKCDEDGVEIYDGTEELSI